jgi:signal transduction histidine kinase
VTADPPDTETYFKNRWFAANPIARRIGTIGLTAGIGLVYFWVAHLSLYLVLKPEGVAVFWPAAGITSGFLVALGPRARWPVAGGAIVATIAAHIPTPDPLWAGVAFGVCNAAEALIVGALVERYFGRKFTLDRLRHVLGLIGAAVAATTISGVGGAVTYRLMIGPSASILISLWHWLASDTFGIVTVAPIVIGITAAIREQPKRIELIEGIAAIGALAMMTGIIILLPPELWETAVPAALLLPMLFWLAARCRPVFTAAGVFIVCLTIAWTTIFGIGHFGDTSLKIGDRILQSQAVILVVALGSFVLVALFAERKDSEARLAQANAMLRRERDNKLMTLEAIVASIGHEVRQPLTKIAMSGDAGLRSLARSPPDLEKVRSALNVVVNESHRASQIFNNLRALFGRGEQERDVVDLNKMTSEVLEILGADLADHGITARLQLAPSLPFVIGHKGQLQEVLINLINNAIEAMETLKNESHVLQVKTEHCEDTITLTVEDSGPGIDPAKLEGVFDAFFTTKRRGMGLGLAICRMIIEQHAGRLAASPAHPHGAVFHVILPQRLG